MQKQIITQPVTTNKQPAKKKKNKGWSEPLEPLPQQIERPGPGQTHKEVEENAQNAYIAKESLKVTTNGTKKLSEMSSLYHVEMSLELGSGFASIVYLGECLTTLKPVCVKVIDLQVLGGSKERLALQRQIRYLRQLDSPYVVKLLDSFESPNFCYIVMEYCAGGDLYRFMRKSPPLHPLFVREIIEQICKGLLELKEHKLIHRDFKTENILLGTNFQAKIGDLGFCVSLEDEELIHNVGSPIYMSPQVLSGGSHSYSSDIYGLGIIWYELLHGSAPWQALNEADLLKKKVQLPISSFREDLNASDRAIIAKCVDVVPENRCQVQQILAYCTSVNKPEKQRLMALRQQEEKQASPVAEIVDAV